MIRTDSKAIWFARKMAIVFVAAVALLFSLANLYSPVKAHADSLSVAVSSKNTVLATSAAERKAYNRAVAACMDYENQPNPIVVDMSDLNLSKKQAKNVWNMIHTNGELFWINCYDDTYTSKEFRLPCYYSDAKITKMRAKLESAVQQALKRIGPGMNATTKVHMLHDYILEHMDYKKKNKSAYTGLVKGKGDCFGFTLAMDLLLRRSGFKTDVAMNAKLDHSWNLVKMGSRWYHVDTTWDNGYEGKDYGGNFNWKDKHCHLYLLQSDESMNNRTTDPVTGCFIRDHAGWTCHHKCLSTKHDFSRTLNKELYRHCADYKSIVRSFTVGKAEYKVIGFKKARLVKGASAKSRITYSGVTYKVVT